MKSAKMRKLTKGIQRPQDINYEVGEQLAETSRKICGMQVEKTIIQQRQIQHTETAYIK